MKRSGVWLLLLAALLAVAVAAVAGAAAQSDEVDWLQPSFVEELSSASATEAAAAAIDAAALAEVEQEVDQQLNVDAEAEADADAEVAADADSEESSALQAEAEAEAEEESASALLEVTSDRRRRRARRDAPAAGGRSSSARAPRVRRSLKVSRRPGHGYGISPRPVRRVQQRLPEARLTGAAATLTRANVRCVLCQYIAQKLKNSLTAGDANAAASAAANPADAAAASAAMIESFAFASPSDEARIVSLVETAASADASAQASVGALPTVFDSGREASRRFRHTDILAHRAGRARFTQVRANQPGKDTDATRAAYLRLYSTVYASFETLCAKRMPLAYLPYCNDMLKSYRFFAQGVNYGDRAEQICMNGNFCDARSYIRRVTHNTYQREPGDA